jgi:hypothetical protein
MPVDVRDRFKALKVLYDSINDLCLEEQRQFRLLDLKYEKQYQ